MDDNKELEQNNEEEQIVKKDFLGKLGIILLSLLLSLITVIAVFLN